MANVIAKFPQPLDSFSINLTVENQTATTIRGFGISGLTARFPITWDSFGAFAGPAVVTSTNGLDTNVVFVRFANFGPGETVQFNGIDPDFTGDTSSGVRNIDIEGARAIVLLGDGSILFGEFEVDAQGDVTAVLN